MRVTEKEQKKKYKYFKYLHLEQLRRDIIFCFSDKKVIFKAAPPNKDCDMIYCYFINLKQKYLFIYISKIIFRH